MNYWHDNCLFTSPQDIFSLSAYRREKRTQLIPLHFSRLCVDFSSFAVVAYLLPLRGAVRIGMKFRRWSSFPLRNVTIYYNCKHVRKLQSFSQNTWCWACTKKRSTHRLQAIKHRITPKAESCTYRLAVFKKVRIFEHYCTCWMKITSCREKEITLV